MDWGLSVSLLYQLVGCVSRAKHYYIIALPVMSAIVQRHGISFAVLTELPNFALKAIYSSMQTSRFICCLPFYYMLNLCIVQHFREEPLVENFCFLVNQQFSPQFNHSFLLVKTRIHRCLATVFAIDNLHHQYLYNIWRTSGSNKVGFQSSTSTKSPSSRGKHSLSCLHGGHVTSAATADAVVLSCPRP